MDEHLELHIGHGGMNGLYLTDRELASQYCPMKAQRLKPLHLVGSPGVALGAGMQELCPPALCRQRALALKGIEHTHVLQQQGIDTGCLQLLNHLQGVPDLRIVDYGVDRDMHLGMKLMGVVAQLTDILDRVTRSRTGTKLGCSDIYGICAMVDGCDAAL